MRAFTGVALTAIVIATAQTRPPGGDVPRVGNGVSAPRVLSKIEPTYSEFARAEDIQGTVVFQIVVNEQGLPADIQVLSPLGFGLDERAEEAIRLWRFAPGMKEGNPVKVLATIEVNSRLNDGAFDEKRERQRTQFNIALQHIMKGPPKTVDDAVKRMQELAEKKFPPAMGMVGAWEMTGEHLPKNVADGLALLQKAAAKNYGAALYEIGIREIEGQDLPKDPEKGLEKMRRASMLGSAQAQFYLGKKYQAGDGVPQALDQARRYFRLCASRGVAACQYRMGKLLLENADRPERDYVQGVAWTQLAAAQGDAEAQQIADREAPNLTPSQEKWVGNLKTQLIQK